MAEPIVATERQTVNPGQGFYLGTRDENLPPLPMDQSKVEGLLVQILQLTVTEYKWLRKRLDDVS